MPDLVVNTKYGAVRGVSIDNVVAFKGIPYAAPPFGANRFKTPQPVVAWDGVRDTSNYGPTVIKPPYFPPFDSLFVEPQYPGEECLNLNIWTPDLGQARLPVYVWVHGGAFANGSNAVPAYDGAKFARDGIVCVVINYRLGADGFLFLDDGISNLGILDQVTALRWVQENIRAFGGDPENVTIGGESAGSFSVTTLLSMPLTKGLFRRVIAQSGAGHHVLSTGTAKRVGGYLADKLGVAPTREAIAAVSFEKLVMAQARLSGEVFANPNPAVWGEVAGNVMPFEPVVDGDIIPARPIDGLFAGAGAGVDLLVGTNTEEYRLFMVPNNSIAYINDTFLSRAIMAYGLPLHETLFTYKEKRPEASAGELLEAIATDWFFRIPAIRLAEAQQNQGGATYMYEFSWRSPEYDGRLGACHALEIAFAFDNLDKDNGRLGTGNPQHLADSMHASWVSFITTGNPGWQQYELDQRATMNFNLTNQLQFDPRWEERILWEGKR
ncbi:MAG: carboxylesterase/lipase family protein [Chloroflexi bacterium]|uniref:Carboxylic ester hydrolase n=1 Tax=Candidatus Chlorohelix allophototropha TaxID=3003348 RepID=A0A8T7M1I1_9CHLR|nr:carboxylesterase/lipase family protein [Chloroflexota bacterium]WJW67840.1 carboxylesterase/lipase family protein [Chloroflexota bacterium L227-S17]